MFIFDFPIDSLLGKFLWKLNSSYNLSEQSSQSCTFLIFSDWVRFYKLLSLLPEERFICFTEVFSFHEWINLSCRHKNSFSWHCVHINTCETQQRWSKIQCFLKVSWLFLLLIHWYLAAWPSLQICSLISLKKEVN